MSFTRGLLYIFLSTVLVSGTAWMGWFYYKHVQHLRRQDSTYNIVAIIQTGPEKEVLKTAYLAEILDLSADKPQNLYGFDTKEAMQKLQASPLIKKVVVQRIRPGALYIDYMVRQPIAYLGDYVNTAVDEEGYLFPFYPFFTPKKLPELVIGLSPFSTTGGGEWSHPLKGREVTLGLEIIKTFQENCVFKSIALKRVDVSKAYQNSPGEREIVLILEERIERQEKGRSALYVYPRILRLEVSHYAEQMNNYLTLRSYLALNAIPGVEGEGLVKTARPLLIDLRINDLAFIK